MCWSLLLEMLSGDSKSFPLLLFIGLVCYANAFVAAVGEPVLLLFPTLIKASKRAMSAWIGVEIRVNAFCNACLGCYKFAALQGLLLFCNLSWFYALERGGKPRQGVGRHPPWKFIQVGCLGREMSPALPMASAISRLSFRGEISVSTRVALTPAKPCSLRCSHWF